jgi:hypothetical protein
VVKTSFEAHAQSIRVAIFEVITRIFILIFIQIFGNLLAFFCAPNLTTGPSLAVKVDDVISRLNQVAQGKYPRGKAQNSPQNQLAQEQPQQAQQPQQSQQSQQAKQAKQPQQAQQSQQPQQTQQKPSVQNQQQQTNNQKQEVSEQKPAQSSNNTPGQNKMLNSIGGNVPQENTPNKAESPNNGYSAEANELIKSFGSFRSKDTDVVDRLQGIYNNLNDDEKEKIKQQVNPDIINLINLQQSNAPWEQLNQVYGSLSPQDRGIFRVITGTKHSSQTNQEVKPQQPAAEQPAPQQNNKQQPSETGNTPKAKGPGFKEKAGNALSTGAKKVKNTLAKGTQKVKDAVAKGYNNLKDKVSATKNKKNPEIVEPEIVEPEIVETPSTKKTQTNSLVPASARPQLSPGGRPMRDVKSRVVGNDNAGNQANSSGQMKMLGNGDASSNQLALPAPATPSTPQSQATKQPSKKVLSPSEKAKKAIAKAQANVQKAKANAPKLNVPNAGKPIKRRKIVNAKQRKDIAAASKEMEDFHRSLGDTGAEWEERIHESYYGSNTRGQLSMLNSIR